MAWLAKMVTATILIQGAIWMWCVIISYKWFVSELGSEGWGEKATNSTCMIHEKKWFALSAIVTPTTITTPSHYNAILCVFFSLYYDKLYLQLCSICFYMKINYFTMNSYLSLYIAYLAITIAKCVVLSRICIILMETQKHSNQIYHTVVFLEQRRTVHNSLKYFLMSKMSIHLTPPL